MSGVLAESLDEPDSGVLAGLRWRLEMWAWSIAYVFLAVPALILFCLLSVSLSTVVVVLGMAFLLALVPLTAQLANLHRKIASHILGGDVERPYLQSNNTSPLAMLRGWAADPARWRDYGWTFVTISAGWALSWLAFGLGLAVVFYLVYPFLFWVTPAGVFEENYGLFQLDTQAMSFLQWILAVLAGLMWWSLTHRLVRWRAMLDRAMLGPSRQQLERRVADVSRTRGQALDDSAAELRRVERDLHDGAQARLVSLGMSLGMAEQLIHRDPQAAIDLLAEARESTSTALNDLRLVVRGIHPPVLSDRGLVGAVCALALDMAMPVNVESSLAGRPSLAVESALYFGVAECMANIAKHSAASQATVTFTYLEATHTDTGTLRVEVDDNGIGGASQTGGGLAGVQRRLAAFDGTLDVSSPQAGPTLVTMVVPCVLS